MNYQVIAHEHIFRSETYFKQCHASTVCLLEDGSIVSAWFAGDHEKAPNVAIWFAKRKNGVWSEPVKVADEENVPCWNPVLFLHEKTLYLFYKVGNEIPRWQTMVKTSVDSGETWSKARELVEGDFGGRGPVKNKCIHLQDGSILAPASTEEGGWNCFTDHSVDGITWTRSDNIEIDRESLQGTGTIQPTLWQEKDGMLHMYMRSSEGKIYASDSDNHGKSWCKAYPTELPNNNCGIDLTQLEDGTLVLVCNPVSGNWAARTPIAFLTSADQGKTWSDPQILDYVPCDTNKEWAEFSYPAIVSKGRDLYITYTWKRRTVAFWQIRLHEA